MTTLCSIPLSSCLMNASGCYSSTLDQINKLDKTKSCAVVMSKSCTVISQDGNLRPRLYLDDTQCLNSMGLPNLGHDYYSNININKPYIQSIYPKTIDDLDKLFDTNSKIIEVNMSCPNVSSSYNINNYESYLDKIYQLKKDKIVGLKLAPIFDLKEYHIMSNMILKYDINFITCSNSIPNCLIVDFINEKTVIKPNNGLGGMSLKAISLSNVYNFHKILKDKVDIIGAGGITCGKDVFEYILCGAKCVQIGSTLLRDGTKCFERIENELHDIMKMKNYNKISDFYGKIKLCDAKL